MRFRGRIGLFFTGLLILFAAQTVLAHGSRTPAGLLRPRIERELRAAARETQVPYELLAAIAFVESRWTNPIPDGEHAPLFGVMGLRDDDWFGSSLSKAARLVGLPPEALKSNVSANVRGAAKLLRSLKGPAKSRSLLDWKEAVLEYSGIPSSADRELYWEDLLKRLALGYSKHGIHIPDNLALKRRLGLDRHSLLPTTPDPVIEWDPSPNFDAGQVNPKYVVIHTTQGSFAGAVSWLKNPLAKASAHYVIRASDGYIKNLVKETDKAWHVRCWNPVTIGIEHEGFVEDPESYTEALVQASAWLTRRIVSTHSIPIDDMHVFGHDFWMTERYRAGHPDDLPNCNDHSDPGVYWDWSRYFELLR